MKDGQRLSHLLRALLHQSLATLQHVYFHFLFQVLDWDDYETWPAVYSVCCVLGIGLLHCLLFGLAKLRVFLYSKCHPSATAPHADVKYHKQAYQSQTSGV